MYNFSVYKEIAFPFVLSLDLDKNGMFQLLFHPNSYSVLNCITYEHNSANILGKQALKPPQTTGVQNTLFLVPSSYFSKVELP